MLSPKFLLILNSIAVIALAGCRTPEPAFLTEKPSEIPQHSSLEWMNQQRESDEIAEAGFNAIDCYLVRDDWFRSRHLYHAMNDFNQCWRLNPHNYQAYWGCGLVRGIQATMTGCDPKQSEQYLRQSIQFIELAMKYHVPEEKTAAFRLNLAHAYNSLGLACQGSDSGTAKLCFEKAKTILLSEKAKNRDSGRLYGLLAQNASYRKQYQEALEWARQARQNGARVPQDFIADMTGKCMDTKTNEKPIKCNVKK